MRDLIYSNARLVALYDTLNPTGPDTDFYVRIAGDQPLKVLDIGCGTGQLAIALAAAGHEVTGIDPSKAMLAVARRRPGGDRVTWIETNAVTAHLDQRYDFIVMSGHTFQVFVEDEDIREMLRNIREHLVPKGRFAFETRNPNVRAWEAWTPEASMRRISDARGRPVDVHHRLVAVEDSHVTFETMYQFDDRTETLVSRSTIRFLPQERIALHLQAAGFREVEWFGDWTGSPFTDRSPEIIVVAR
jgi:ubiquinone/menaquinone biosynthesis C-methylase UbiE